MRNIYGLIRITLLVACFHVGAVDLGSCPTDRAADCNSRGQWPGGPCVLDTIGQDHYYSYGSHEVSFKYLCVCWDPELTIDMSCYANRQIPQPETPVVTNERTRMCYMSTVNMETGTVVKKVPVLGTSFDLVYSSERALGYEKAYKFTLPITGTTYPSDIQNFAVEVNYSDRTDNHNLVPTPDLDFNFQWDGKDLAGNYVHGVKARVDVGEVATGRPYPDVPLIYYFDIGNWQTIFVGLGGWTLSNHHFYNPSQRRLHLGNGDARSVRSTSLPGGGHRVASKDGSEVYDFDSAGNHIYTRHGLTGSIIYTFTYDANGRLASITDAFSNQTTVVRGPSGNLVGISSPDGQLTSLTLNVDGLLSQVSNPSSEVHSMTYWNGDGLLKTFETPKGLVSTFNYDSEGILLNETDSVGALLNLSRATDSDGTLSVNAESAEGRVTTYNFFRYLSDDFERNTVAHGHYNLHFTASKEHENIQSGIISTFSGLEDDPRFGFQAPYNEDISVSSSLGVGLNIQNSRAANLSNFSDPFSIQDLTYISDINGHISTTTYTSATKAMTDTTPEGRVSTSVLNANGQLVSYQKSTLTPLTFQYDNRGRLWKLEQGARFTSWTFDSNGYINSWTNALNETTTVVNNSAGRPSAITLPDTRVLSISYDADGVISTITPPGRTAHSLVVNLWNLIASYLPPSLGGPTTTNYTYNNDKQLIQINRPAGQTINVNYDSNSGLLAGIETPNQTYEYGVDYFSGKINHAYDFSDIQVSFSYGGSLLVSESVYDVAVGDYSGSTYYRYDNSFRISQEDLIEADWSTISTITYQYDNDGLVTVAENQTLNYNSVTGLLSGTTLGSVTDSYSYNSFGEVITYVAKYNGNNIYEYSLTRDDLGRVTTKIETLGAVTNTFVYSYDPTGRLTDVTKNGQPYSHYDYDSNNNIVSGNRGGVAISATYDGQDQISTWGTKTYTHNLNGELVQVVNSSPSQTFTFTYNDLGYLKAVQTPSTTVDYKVDALQRRADRAVGSVTQAKYIYNPRGFLMGRMSDSGTVANHYVYSSKNHVPDYFISGGIEYRIISDHLGSVRMVVDTTTGAQVQILEYDEYGKVLSDTNPGFQDFGFAGGVYDPETGLVHFKHREYNPETGRWLTKDPLLFSGTKTNLYGYAVQDPINYIDPEGLQLDDLLQVGVYFQRLSAHRASQFWKQGRAVMRDGGRATGMPAILGAAPARVKGTVSASLLPTGLCQMMPESCGYLMDEDFSALDAIIRSRIRSTTSLPLAVPDALGNSPNQCM